VEPLTPQSELRRSTMTTRSPERYSPALHYLLLTDSAESECYEEALQVEDKVKLELTMDDEMESLIKNQTWNLVKLSESKRALQNKWVYRLKEDHDGTKRYKARIVVKRFQQREGIDFNQIFLSCCETNYYKICLEYYDSRELIFRIVEC